MEFYRLRKEAGLNSEKAAKLFNVTTRTIKNWDKSNKPPRAVFLYLSVLVGRLDHLGQDWKGYKFAGNCIESPNGDFIYSYEVRAIKYLWTAAGISRTQAVIKLKN